MNVTLKIIFCFSFKFSNLKTKYLSRYGKGLFTILIHDPTFSRPEVRLSMSPSSAMLFLFYQMLRHVVLTRDNSDFFLSKKKFSSSLERFSADE